MTNEASSSSTAAWPIFVLSLPDSTERRQDISYQFEELGLEFSFFDAVDGRQGLAADLEHLVDRPGTEALFGYGMSDAEYACALSHQFAYQKILDENLPGAIILEDDAILTHRFKDFIEGRNYEAAPLIQMCYYKAISWRGRSIDLATLRLERLSESAWTAAGYSISATSAAIMRDASLPLRARADWPCDTVKLIGHYITVPRLVLHPPPTLAQSTIKSSASSMIPEDHDFSSGYAKGWRRLYNLASWKRLIKRQFTRSIELDLEPTRDEASSIVISSGHFKEH